MDMCINNSFQIMVMCINHINLSSICFVNDAAYVLIWYKCEKSFLQIITITAIPACRINKHSKKKKELSGKRKECVR